LMMFALSIIIYIFKKMYDKKNNLSSKSEA